MRERVRLLNQAPFRQNARYIIYWAQMNRRTASNHGLAYAIELANGMALPVLYYEGLTCSYPYASDRLHQFILENVPGTAEDLRKAGIGYTFHLRRRTSDPNDALYRLALNAAAVVTDDYPTFVARRHNAHVPARLDVPYFVVDSSCIVPMSRLEKREYAAYTIRPRIHRILDQYLQPFEMPTVTKRWKADQDVAALHTNVTPRNISSLVQSCEIDHSIAASTTFRGGSQQAHELLDYFVAQNLARYASKRNEPSAHVTSDLSPYLHFGNISSLEIALKVKSHAATAGLIPDEFLEELIVRRELAFNFARFTDDPESLENLPNWALATLAKHDSDPRDYTYSREEWERANTHDALWNATQKELLLRGKIHGYYRMYWGKKIVEWSASHKEALAVMIYLHDKYALDGRDPNTYTNILWCLGLHDRPWIERPVFGMIRYMSGDGMKRKTNTAAYIKEIEYLERTA
ncbi:MAG TPA: deoxyribodipyrimidine photo-lyase [Bryobacteraceae bacterium]|jgi:deoxyribodipyrimidine photo-lyase